MILYDTNQFFVLVWYCIDTNQILYWYDTVIFLLMDSEILSNINIILLITNIILMLV